MTRKSEKFANLAISLVEPPRIQMTCNTSDFRLESFSSDINDKNYLHLPPPIPDFCLKQDNICYTDVPMYAMAVATNKYSTLMRDCSVYGTVFFESKDLGRFSSSTVGLTDFIIQPNEQVFIPFQIKVPHLLSSISSQTKVSRSASCFNTEIGSNQKIEEPTKSITVNSFFHFKINETNQKMQINILEKINLKNSVSISYKFSNPISTKERLPLFQVVLKNQYNLFIRNVELQTLDPKPHSPIPSFSANADNSETSSKRKKNGHNLIKLGEFIGPGEVYSGYISYPDLFNLMEIYFSLPHCYFCSFTEPILASLSFSQKATTIKMDQSPLDRQSSTVINNRPNITINANTSPHSTPGKKKNQPNRNMTTLNNRPLLTIPPKSSQLQSPNFQANLNKLPKAVQTLRPFAVQLQIINTFKKEGENSNKNGVISGSVSLAENESILLYGNNNLSIPNIQPGQSHVVVINLIALKQGKFPFPTITVRLNNFRNTQVDFDTGIIAIGCNE